MRNLLIKSTKFATFLAFILAIFAIQSCEEASAIDPNVNKRAVDPIEDPPDDPYYDLDPIGYQVTELYEYSASSPLVSIPWQSAHTRFLTHSARIDTTGDSLRFEIEVEAENLLDDYSPKREDRVKSFRIKFSYELGKNDLVQYENAKFGDGVGGNFWSEVRLKKYSNGTVILLAGNDGDFLVWRQVNHDPASGEIYIVVGFNLLTVLDSKTEMLTFETLYSYN